MIQVQFVARQFPSTILACALVAGVDIIATEANMPLRDAIIAHEKDDARDADRAIDHADGFVVHRNRKVTPAIEVERLILLVYRPSNALIKQREGSPYRSNMNGQIRAVEDEDFGIEKGMTQTSYGRAHWKEILAQNKTFFQK